MKASLSCGSHPTSSLEILGMDRLRYRTLAVVSSEHKRTDRRSLPALDFDRQCLWLMPPSGSNPFKPTVTRRHVDDPLLPCPGGHRPSRSRAILTVDNAQEQPNRNLIRCRLSGVNRRWKHFISDFYSRVAVRMQPSTSGSHFGPLFGCCLQFRVPGS